MHKRDRFFYLVAISWIVLYLLVWDTKELVAYKNPSLCLYICKVLNFVIDDRKGLCFCDINTVSGWLWWWTIFTIVITAIYILVLRLSERSNR